MLFEEAVLFLLRRAGYKTIDTPDGETIRSMGAGLGVFGRGGVHQIDAIADYEITPPFSHPQRLLVEAKCYGARIGIEVIRNAVGVVKDVNEFWNPRTGKTTRRRYHYLQAVFSTSEFTSEAEDYAFAQDIFLFPIGRSTHLSRLLTAINAIKPPSFGGTHWTSVPVNLSELRRNVRTVLESFDMPVEARDFGWSQGLWRFVEEVRVLGGVVIGVLGRSFPLFLVPRSAEIFDELNGDQIVRIYWDEHSWYIRSQSGELLFSFDLPPRLFARYAQAGLLSRERAIDLKRDFFNDLHVMIVEPEGVRVIRFTLDPDWIQQLANQAEHRRPGSFATTEEEPL